MKRIMQITAVLALLLFLVGCGRNGKMESSPESKTLQAAARAKEESPMKIKVSDGKNTVVFALNQSQAAKDLWNQLPLTIGVENYGSSEKIFYPKMLRTENTPAADARAGTLAYYAPWGDVVMFYRDFGSAGGLYQLGEAESGRDGIAGLMGKITIEKQ